MKYGRNFDENGNRVMWHEMPQYFRKDGAFIRRDEIVLAEEFFGMSPEDVIALDDNKFAALRKLDEWFGELHDRIIFAIYNDGFGETFDEMYAHSKDGMMLPEFVRKFIEKQVGESWDKIDDWIISTDYWDFIHESMTEKYGLPVWRHEEDH